MTTQTIVKCGACNGLNSHGLPYCMFCGSSLVGTDDVRLISPRPCNACSVVDPLSQKYCVSCGASMNSSKEHALPLQQKTELAQTTSRLNQLEKKRLQKRRKRQAFTAAALAIAAVLGGTYLISQHQLRENTGVLVYASPSGADVFVEDAHNCLIKSGKVKPNGELLLKGFAPGRYSLTISRIGYKPKEQSVVVLPNKIAAVGIPERIDLLAANTPDLPIQDSNVIETFSKSTVSSNQTAPQPKSTRRDESRTKSTPKTTEPPERVQTKVAAGPSTDKELASKPTSEETSQTEPSSDMATQTEAPPLAPPIAQLSPEQHRGQQLPPFADRRFGRTANGPFRAVGYPMLVPARPNLENEPIGSFDEQNPAPPYDRFRPKMRRFMKMIQSEPVHRPINP